MSKSKYIDVSSIIQVIGGIYNSPSILDNDYKYHFNEEDFPDKFHKILFSAIFNLHALGAKEISINNIEDYLEQKPKRFAIYKDNKGAEYLKQISETTQVAAFDYYYNRMKKMTLFRCYEEVGMDLSWLYDPDNILDAKKKQKQEEWLDNTSIEDIANIMDRKITQIRDKYVNNSDEKAITKAGKGAVDLINRLKKTPEIGYPLYGSIVNKIHRGARFKKFYLRSGSTGAGKALPNSTIIPTPAGNKRVGDIKVGDYLFDALGKPTLVEAVYPQGKKELWEIIFEDGRKARCCKDHLWSYCTSFQSSFDKQDRNFYTDTTEEIYKKFLKKEYNILIPLTKAVEYEKKIYNVDPYTMGMFFGNGYCKYSIPTKYLEGDINQRTRLLNGLMNSKNGFIGDNGKMFYFTTNILLKNDIIKLANSLGFKNDFTLNISSSSNKICYRIEIDASTGKEYLFNTIISIKKLNIKEEMTCFYVDNDEHLFLMNDYIVTHNTRTMIADACYIGCDEIYDENKHEWVKNGTKESVMYNTTEQDLEEVQTMMIAFLSAVEEEHILNGEYLPGEWERVEYASKLLDQCPIYIKELPDFSLQDIENVIKFGINEYGVKYIFHDYIHSSLKILSEVSSKTKVQSLREDNILFMISVKIKDICNKYSVFILSGTQLNGEYKNTKVFDQNLLRGAKSIADRCDCGMILLEVTQEDKEALKDIVEQMGVEMPGIKMSFYKNRRGRYKNILLWCKDRRGICRIDPMFVTNYRYELIKIDDLRINVEEDKELGTECKN